MRDIIRLVPSRYKRYSVNRGVQFNPKTLRLPAALAGSAVCAALTLMVIAGGSQTESPTIDQPAPKPVQTAAQTSQPQESVASTGGSLPPQDDAAWPASNPNGTGNTVRWWPSPWPASAPATPSSPPPTPQENVIPPMAIPQPSEPVPPATGSEGDPPDTPVPGEDPTPVPTDPDPIIVVPPVVDLPVVPLDIPTEISL